MGHKSSQKRAQHSAPAVEFCPQCRAFVGRNYPQCLYCREVAEQPIKACWQALLRAQNIAPNTSSERELAATILAESDHYWWSEVEAALRSVCASIFCCRRKSANGLNSFHVC